MGSRRGQATRRLGVGRPPKPPEERQRNRVALSFTDSEFEALEIAAQGRPVATVVREIVVRCLARRQR